MCNIIFFSINVVLENDLNIIVVIENDLNIIVVIENDLNIIVVFCCYYYVLLTSDFISRKH